LKRALRVPDNEAATLSRNDKVRDMCKGQRCFVIGNGPSLNNQDLSLLADETTIVMNHFNKNPILKRWQPTFYCAADPEEYLRGFISRGMLKGIEAQEYFFNINTRQMLSELHILDPKRVYYLMITTGIAFLDWPVDDYPLDLTASLPAMPTTAHMAILVAIFLGCTPIYLIGLDHDYLAHRSVDRHFYPVPEGEMNLLDRTYKMVMKDCIYMWNGYEVLKTVAERRGQQIFNATKGGFLDVFPRVSYESLVK